MPDYHKGNDAVNYTESEFKSILDRNREERAEMTLIAMAREIIERRAKERSLMEAVYTKLGDHGGGCPEDAT